MLKIAHIAIMIILTAVILAGCTGTTNNPTATPTATAPSNQPAVNQSVTPTPPAQVSSPTPTVAPNRTTKAQIRTITSLVNVEFRVYADKVVVDYLNGVGNLTVIASNTAGSGEQIQYMSRPGDSVTVGYNETMLREPGQEANIFVYQPTDSGMTYGGTKYYPRTGEIKQN